MFKKKYYWWNMVFMQEGTSGYKLGSVYYGSEYKNIQKKNIEDARTFGGFADGYILISCSYLGRMTRDKFNDDCILAPDQQNERGA